jgi:hypothetical protein
VIQKIIAVEDSEKSSILSLSKKRTAAVVPEGRKTAGLGGGSQRDRSRGSCKNNRTTFNSNNRPNRKPINHPRKSFAMLLKKVASHY